MNIIDNEILDIKFYEDNVFLLKKYILTSSDIENQVLNFNYSGEKLVKDELVEKSKIPPFITIFYKYIFENNSIPTEDLFFDYYINSYYNSIEDISKCILKQHLQKNYSSLIFNKNGIKARLLRSYPSLIRDFHFYLMCSESKLFEKVVYSLNTDYFDGYDLIINYNNFKFAVSLYIETNRGNYYKYKKQYRHEYNRYKEIILKINKNECKQIGRFYFYTNDHVHKLLRIIKDNV